MKQPRRADWMSWAAAGTRHKVFSSCSQRRKKGDDSVSECLISKRCVDDALPAAAQTSPPRKSPPPPLDTTLSLPPFCFSICGAFFLSISPLTPPPLIPASFSG
ncbi:hypothetical protein V2G26_011524 [Clonostachys chloroleuca]